MANTKKYVSLDKLSLYDDKIKKVITDGDAASLKSAKDYADSLATNYEVAGAAATAEANAKAYADGKDAAISAAQTAADNAAAAAGIADGKAVAAQTDVDNLETYVGTFTHDTAKTVVEYINAKTDGIATSGNLEALGARVTAVEGDVATIKGDYLKAADKTELEGKIDAVQTAVDTEKGRAEGIESGLRTDVDAIKADYLKAEDKTELQGNIDTVAGAVERLTNGVSADEIDGVNDLINYVKEHGTEVTGMQEDIAENAEAISGVAGRMTTAEGKITAVEGAVATKAEKTYVDEQVQALQGVDTGIDNRLKAVEAKFGSGEGNVESQIATAKQEAIDAAAADATTKANTAESNAKSHADGLNTAMNARVEALEAIDHDHANKAELDLIATGDKAKWDEAAGKAHEHGNKTVLDGITADKVTAWDKVTAKADQTALQAEIDRATAAEQANAAAIAAFVEVSQEEIEALFA